MSPLPRLGWWLGLALAAGRPAPGTARTAAGGDGGQPAADLPVRVGCDDMVVENRSQTARCEGHVKATRQAMVLTCDHSLAHYDPQGRILDLTCRGEVRVVDRDRTATADQAVYRDADRIIALSGHAQVRQRDDELAGEPILFYVDEDRVVAKEAKLKGRTADLPARANGSAAGSAGGSPGGPSNGSAVGRGGGAGQPPAAADPGVQPAPFAPRPQQTLDADGVPADPSPPDAGPHG